MLRQHQPEISWMRALVPTTILLATLLATSGLYPSFAQDEGKPPVSPMQQPAPAQNSPPQSDQQRDSDQPRTDNPEVGRDWRVRPDDRDQATGRTGPTDRNDRTARGQDRMDRDQREVGRDWRMHPGPDSDARDRYRDREYRGWDRAERDGYRRNYHDEDRLRRRMKVCVEYENGDEYCRYRE